MLGPKAIQRLRLDQELRPISQSLHDGEIIALSSQLEGRILPAALDLAVMSDAPL